LHYTLREGGEGFSDDEMSVVLRVKRKRISLYGGETKAHSGDAKYGHIVWKKIPNVAQYGGADWKNEVMRLSGIGLTQAKTVAAANPKITYFYEIGDYVPVWKFRSKQRLDGKGLVSTRRCRL